MKMRFWLGIVNLKSVLNLSCLFIGIVSLIPAYAQQSNPYDRTPLGFHIESTFPPAVTADNIRHLCERINGTCGLEIPLEPLDFPKGYKGIQPSAFSFFAFSRRASTVRLHPFWKKGQYHFCSGSNLAIFSLHQSHVLNGIQVPLEHPTAG